MKLAGSLVTLRTVVAADEQALVAIRSTPEVRTRWRGDDLHAEFAKDLADDNVVRLAIIEPNGVVVGLIQFEEEDDPEYRHASVDIYVDPAWHRRGFALDAINTLVNHLFTTGGHHRITIDPAADNLPAIACYTKAGFVSVGVMREYEQQADGSWSDGLLMELLKSDWDLN